MKRLLLASLALLLGVLLHVSAAPDKNAKPPAERKAEILKLFADELVSITPGKGVFPASFEMGSKDKGAAHEKPAHKVTLTKPIGFAKYEVTQELYEAVMGVNPSKWKGPRNAIEMTSWDDTQAFCLKLTKDLQAAKLIGEKDIIRLPTEAEWEYCCRAGTTSAYSFGDDSALLKDFSWFKGNSKGEDPPIGKKKPNAWGLYDMHGYCWEWCQDSWHDTYEKAPTDGSAWEEKESKARVLRGGSWADFEDSHRSAFRKQAPATEKSDTIGFRCVKAGQ